MNSLLFPGYILSRGNTQSENMCDIVFEKVKGHGITVKKIAIMQKQPSEGFYKKSVKRNFVKFPRN